MDLIERLTYLAVGGFLGFVLGYVCGKLDRIKEEVDEIDEIVKKERNEEGVARLRPVIQDVVLFSVVALVAYAAFSAQKTNNELEQQQVHTEKVTECNLKFLEKTIAALNERTVFTVEQTRSNVRVQRAQADFWLGLYDNPGDDQVELELARRYALALKDFVEESKDMGTSLKDYPYATPAELRECLN